MDLFEYQARDVLDKHGVPVLGGVVARTPEEARAAAEQLGGGTVVVKAQVKTGGRGKAGGIQLAADPAEAEEKARQVLGLDIRGHVVRTLWIEKASDIAREYYLSVTFDRGAKKPLFMFTTQGGVEIEQIAEAHAEVTFLETGVDPMVRDRKGFMERVARRIEMGRTFLVFDGGKLLFKADIIAEADGIVYLEGIYVAPDARGKGVGSKCLSRLTRMLLDRAEKICMLSNVRFENAHRSFENAGYRVTGRCTTLFV